MRLASASHLRRNAVAYLALFVALTSTSVAAVTLPRNSVSSPQIRDGQVKRADVARNAIISNRVADGSLRASDFARDQLPAGPQGPAGPIGPVGPQGPPGPIDDSRYVNEGQADSVTPAMIPDRTRSVSVPLTSFVDCDSSGAAAVDFTSGADRKPDIVETGANNGEGYGIRWDDDPGNEDQFWDICAQTNVPLDWVSGGRIRVRGTVGSAPSAPIERIRCRFFPRGSAAEVQLANTAGGQAYTCQPVAPVLAPGTALTVNLAVTVDGAMNDPFHAVSVEFLYEADS